MLVTEGHRFERQYDFARFIHRLNRFLETGRGRNDAELTTGTYMNCRPCYGYPADTGDKCGLLVSLLANANRFSLRRYTLIADVDIVGACREVLAG